MKKLAIIILAILAISVVVATIVVITSDRKSSDSILDIKSSDNDLRKQYLNTSSGVGFVFHDDFATDLQRANEVGLSFFNAPSLDGEVPEVIRAGFELGYNDLPVPNMAGGSVSDMDGLKQAYLELVRQYDPVFIGLGNELELMTHKSEFVGAYNGIYDAIKAECSDCIIYPTFQYERFEPELIDNLKIDLLALTSYPFARYANLNDIPSNYYDQAFDIASRLDIPVAFTEIGWTHLPAYLSGYSTAGESQAAFYERFSEIIDGRNVQFVSWGLLYGSPETGEEWADLGLYSLDGSRKEPLYSVFTSQ